MAEEDQSIVHRLNAVVERLAAVEAVTINKNKTTLQKISEYGGVIALVLSLIIGGFTLYDELVRKPQAAEIEHRTSIRNAISELSKIQGELNSIDWNDPAAQQKVGAYAPRRIALLEKIRGAYASRSTDLTFPDHLLVASELMQFGKINDAAAHVAEAEKLAVDEPQKAVVYSTQARISAFNGELSEMNRLFRQASEEYVSQGIQYSSVDLLSVYIEWIAYLLVQNTCETAAQVHQQFKNYLFHNEVWPRAREQAKRKFDQMLSNQNQQCDLPEFQDASEISMGHSRN